MRLNTPNVLHPHISIWPNSFFISGKFVRLGTKSICSNSNEQGMHFRRTSPDQRESPDIIGQSSRALRTRGIPNSVGKARTPRRKSGEQSGGPIRRQFSDLMLFVQQFGTGRQTDPEVGRGDLFAIQLQIGRINVVTHLGEKQTPESAARNSPIVFCHLRGQTLPKVCKNKLANYPSTTANIGFSGAISRKLLTCHSFASSCKINDRNFDVLASPTWPQR